MGTWAGPGVTSGSRLWSHQQQSDSGEKGSTCQARSPKSFELLQSLSPSSAAIYKQPRLSLGGSRSSVTVMQCCHLLAGGSVRSAAAGKARRSSTAGCAGLQVPEKTAFPAPGDQHQHHRSCLHRGSRKSVRLGLQAGLGMLPGTASGERARQDQGTPPWAGGTSPAGGCQQQRRGKLRLWNTPGARQRLLPAPAPACPPSAAGPYLPDRLRDAEAAAGPDEAHGRVQAHPVAHGDVEGLGAVVVAPQHLGSQKVGIRH